MNICHTHDEEETNPRSIVFRSFNSTMPGKMIVCIVHLTFLLCASSPSMYYERRHPRYSSLSSLSTSRRMIPTALEHSRTRRDTYDEREKLVSTYKIISKTQCSLQMQSSDGHVGAQLMSNIDDTEESKHWPGAGAEARMTRRLAVLMMC
jgi:hypothetical protein